MEAKQSQDTAILIPSYKPDHKLAPYVSALKEAGFAKIVIVDDGGGPDFAPVFDAIPQGETVQIIHYEPNQGKGVALKRGMQYLLDECPQCAFVITADSDGQHTVQDTLRMSESLHENSQGLLLGSRDFGKGNVPFKSFFGNRITSGVFWLLYGRWIRDTQTGLRGFARDLLPAMLAVRGSRYEYEMNMLIDCAARKLPIRALEIETVYENNNEGSHFRAFQDSARIYGIIFAGFFRFTSASLASFLLDYGLYRLFKALLPGLNHSFRILFFPMGGNILIATFASRILSGTFNFWANQRFVFSKRASVGKSLPRYIFLFFLIMFLSASLTSTLHLWFGFNDNTIKIPVDIALFLLSYQLQQRWVFAKKD